MAEVLKQEPAYTTDYIETLPDGERAELIDGILYNMTPPNRRHQKILGEMYAVIYNFIKSKHGSCEVYPAPFAVYLNKGNYVEPDISVICDPDKLDDKGCSGPPDWIIEITSPSTASRNHVLKMNQYYKSGVREYWIVNPLENVVSVFFFEQKKGLADYYTFKDTIQVNIYEDFEIDFSKFDL